MAYAFWLFLAADLGASAAMLPLLTVPFAWKNVKDCFQIEDRREFNNLLARSAGLQVAFGALACLALAAMA